MVRAIRDRSRKKPRCSGAHSSVKSIKGAEYEKQDSRCGTKISSNYRMQVRGGLKNHGRMSVSG